MIVTTKNTIVKNGIIKETQMGGIFKIEFEDESVALATVSGKMRRAHIRVLIGDKVKVEFSPHDMSRGRVVYRYR